LGTLGHSRRTKLSRRCPSPRSPTVTRRTADRCPSALFPVIALLLFLYLRASSALLVCGAGLTFAPRTLPALGASGYSPQSQPVRPRGLPDPRQRPCPECPDPPVRPDPRPVPWTCSGPSRDYFLRRWVSFRPLEAGLRQYARVRSLPWRAGLHKSRRPPSESRRGRAGRTCDMPLWQARPATDPPVTELERPSQNLH